MRIEELGEILNISTSAGATAVSELVDKEVKLSIGNIEGIQAGSIVLSDYEPTICFEFEFTEGLSDKGIAVMKLSDVASLVGAVLQKEFTEEFELDEVNKTTAAQIMGDLIGGSFSSLSNFANIKVGVSAVEPFAAPETETLIKEYYNSDQEVCLIKYGITVNGVIDSDFVLILTDVQAEGLVGAFNTGLAKTENQVPDDGSVTVGDDAYGNGTDYDIRPVELQRYSESETDNVEQSSNLNMLMNVPLQITVEIGRTKKQIKDILELTTGSIVELSKPAGSHVDVFVNGQQIASGEVVVVDDYYGVRISEIINTGEIMKIL